MITQDQKKTASENLRTLMQKKSDLFGSYDPITHTVEAYRIVTGVQQFRDWFNSIDWIRKRLTMKKSSMFDLWVVDNDAPKLRNKPTHAVIFDKQLDQFRPAISISVVTFSLFYFAVAQATDEAAKCNLFRAKHGRMPTLSDLDGVEKIIVPGPSGADLDPAVADLLARINGPGDTPGPSVDADGGTSQTATLSGSRPNAKQAHNSDRYHLGHRGKHPL